ncbi:phosphoribosylaminoimidazole carboxylase, ATPase subunit [Bartonella bacilliformis Peru38]|uniref:N5-carboxyaminoimidazole ribonucleotide synthase n=2 Tax=Bartonella bacilliformis TaxID=774 RepID=A1URE1_BARBK|nr:5-(carboxyamino)imidazole ribonucleotide synthase [Bartonella bacilliformis]ABM45561.1 phosphoribosylaminoimidazole carboxylase, ATPase subunit [Bartonella bacilliformis KC583]AMG85413.1 5-(carboxyamino)imidazole ribonucleotide synthase [Bartonella bacilliformis]EKS46091.1 phosphoribosylaminoimidazole carboxylase ATPase subunit [Bartonella bacilliformis INS]EYS89151.1 phosphoribosylaminoimidazole carboxylase, ATPase subunit [Bartonella bacilliformis San Pedro600-02]KEG17532.1 phosphoribosyl
MVMNISDPLKPGSTIGLIGGGQLARMLAIAAAELGFQTIILCPEVQCPAAQTANNHIVADYDDQAALQRLIDLCDVVTYEFENLPVTTIQWIEKACRLYPSSKALEISQDRVLEKNFLNEHGIATASWHAVQDQASLLAGLSALNSHELNNNGLNNDGFRGHGLLKARRFGYDGKMQQSLHNPSPQVIAALSTELEKTPSILEEIVPFVAEISVIAARDPHGALVFYDCSENQHKNGILHKACVPSAVPQSVQKAAYEVSTRVLQALEYVGVLCIEFFVLSDGQLLVNELAPRVHNSGHWTQKACVISQFEQHIRAICGLPLGNTERHSNCEMINLLGNNLDDYVSALMQENTSVHLYGKKSVQPERKMGHIIRLTGPATHSV